MVRGPTAYVLTRLALCAMFSCSVALKGKHNIINKTKHPLIVVSMDGVGWQFVESNLTDTPHFDFVAKTGVKARNMVTVNPTSTFPVHTTFLTGLYPESHGIVDNNFYDPRYGETFIFGTDCTNFDPKFYNMSEPIWLTMEKRERKTGAYFWPSSTSYKRRPTYFAKHDCRVDCEKWKGKLWELRAKKGKVHCKFDWDDPYWHRIETAVKWLKSDEPPELILLYFDQTDDQGHEHGPNSHLYLQSVETTDRYAVENLVRELRKNNLLEKVNLIFVSDHSMLETSSKKQIDVFPHLDKTSVHGPGLWVEPERLDEAYRNLTKINSAHVKAYKREDVPEEYHSRHNRRYPPLFLDLEPGWKLRWSPYDEDEEGEWTAGGHGWRPDQQTAALFYARGPSFKKGYSTCKSLRAVDLYPLMCHLLGLEPLPNNGTLANMMEFLKQPRIRN